MLHLTPVSYSLYDTNILFQTIDIRKSEDKFVFFEKPIGTSFFDNNGKEYVKSSYHTNMICSKSLPCPQEFVLHTINVSVPYFPKFGFTGIFDEFKQNSLALDIVNLMEQSYFTVYIYNRIVLNFTWDMLTNCGGNYYYKGQYNCVVPYELLQCGSIYVLFNFGKSIVTSNDIIIKISFDGILKREPR